MKRKDLRNEAEHLPTELGDLVELRERVIAHGVSRQVADGLCMWVLAKSLGEPDSSASDTRSRYRRILRELEPSTAPTGPGRNGHRQAGRGRLRAVGGTMAAAGASAGALALTGSPIVALCVYAPVILEPSVTSSELEVLWELEQAAA